MKVGLSPQTLLSIDYYSVSGTVPSVETARQAIEAILADAGFLPPRWHPLGIYECGVRIPRIGRLFLGHRYPPRNAPKDTCFVSFHFNPNLVDIATVKRILALFSEVRVTRLDVAVDLIHPEVEAWQVIQTRLKGNAFADASFSSVRYGKGSADRQLLFYDKMLERTDKHRRAIRVVDVFGVIHSFDAHELKAQGFSWLRVEARLRKSWIVGGLPKVNPFSDTFVLPTDPAMEVLCLPAAREARLRGVLSRPRLYLAFNPKARRLLREDLRACEWKLLPVSPPSLVASEHHQDLCDAVDNLLGIQRTTPKPVAP